MNDEDLRRLEEKIDAIGEALRAHIERQSGHVYEGVVLETVFPEWKNPREAKR
jgi:hypothetical protein